MPGRGKDKGVAKKEASGFLLVDNVHLKRKHHAGFVDQPVSIIEEKTVFGACGTFKADLGLMAWIGA